MKEIDVGVFELSYAEYLKEAKELKKKDSSFIVRPDNGVTYVSAINSKAGLVCLLEKHAYQQLKESGDWDKGIYRMHNKNRKERPSKVLKEGARVVAIKDRLLAIRKESKESKDLAAVDASIEKLLRDLINGRI